MHLCVEPPKLGGLCAVLRVAALAFQRPVRHCEGFHHVSAIMPGAMKVAHVRGCSLSA
jgi:hypothetical protein